MTVLKGELATEQSKALIRTFKGMKDFIVENRYLIGNKELFQLSIQTAQNTADIAEIKSTMITKTDLAKVVRDFTDPITRREYLILNGESVEANIAYSNIYKSAKSSVFVIDNYIGLKTLVLLKNIVDDIHIVEQSYAVILKKIRVTHTFIRRRRLLEKSRKTFEGDG